MKPKDITGLTVGFLTAIAPYGRDKKGHILWRIRCVCGKDVFLPAAELTKMKKKGIVASCGCKRRETIGRKNRKHGMSHHPAFGVWHSMKERCQCPTHKAYKNYGARGIRVCTSWESFDRFWADMGPSWRKGLTLDRIDNNGDYCPENCRWVTFKVQSNNKRNTIKVDGQPLTFWVEKTGIGRTTLLYRLQHGCPREHLFDKPDLSRKYSIF